MKQCLSSLLLLVLLIVKIDIASSAEIRRLVLVTDTATGIHSLTARESRLLFLGLPVTKEGNPLVAVINRSDPFLYEVFLQKVVFMSSSTYERHLLTKTIQLGGQKPDVYTDTKSLAHALKQAPGTVAVLWENEARNWPSLIILGEIWRGTAD